MAQARKSPAGKSSRGTNRKRSSSSRNGASARSGGGSSGASAKRGSGNAGKRARGATKQSARSASAASDATKDAAPSNLTAATEAAVAGTKAAGQAVSAVASQAKVPLIAAGAGLAGVAGALAVRSRQSGSSSRGFLKGRGPSLPSPNLKLDRKSIAATADRVASISRQVSDIAAAVQRTTEESKRK